MKESVSIRIGTAGWTVPKHVQNRFAQEGTHLTRYASQFSGVEINSSFYRPHRPATYQRWADSVREPFRFAVKVPKAITHEARLQSSQDLLSTFLGEISGLGAKLGPLLVQLPPSLRFDREVAQQFFGNFRDQFRGGIVCEPRHASWSEPAASELLRHFDVSQVIADPPVVPVPPAAQQLVYYRLHGSPRMYYSEYSPSYLRELAEQIASQQTAADIWCIFDNTAAGAATADALQLIERIKARHDG